MSDSHSSPTAAEERRFRALLARGTSLLRQGSVSDATPLLEQAYQLRPSDLDAALNLGGAYILSRKFARAVPILEALSRQAPDNPAVWTNLAAAYLGNPVLSTRKQQRRAVETFKKALALDPKAPHVAYNIGLIYYRYLQDLAEARRWFEQALAADPGDPDVRQILARLDKPRDADGG